VTSRLASLRTGSAGALLVRSAVLLAAVIVFVAFSLASSKFATGANLRNIAVEGAGSAVMAVGMTFVIMTAGIDISIGAMLFLSSAAASELFTKGVPAVWIPLLAVLFGLLLGAVNGVTVGYLSMNPLIVTLATLNLYRGVAGHLTKFSTVYLPSQAQALGTSHIGSIPTPIVVATAVALAGIFLLRATVFGRYVQAVGSNAHAARELGLPVRWVLVSVYAISGLTAGLAGLIENGRLGAVQPTVGTGEELTVITAVVLGGASLFGGRGSIVGSLLGVLILEMVADGLVLAHLSPYLFDIIRASVLLAAVLLAMAQGRLQRPLGGARRLRWGVTPG